MSLYTNEDILKKISGLSLKAIDNKKIYLIKIFACKAQI